VFFTSIVLMLVGMTVWEIKSPTTERRGFLPIATTRGDRLFIGLLSAAWLNLAFVAVSEKMIDWFSLEQRAVDLVQLRGCRWPCWRWSCARAMAFAPSKSAARHPSQRAVPAHQREVPEETDQ
jgi:predicted small integral membrane protein